MHLQTYKNIHSYAPFFYKVLKWIKDLQKQFTAEGREVNNKTIEEFTWQTLNSGKVGIVCVCVIILSLSCVPYLLLSMYMRSLPNGV